MLKHIKVLIKFRCICLQHNSHSYSFYSHNEFTLKCEKYKEFSVSKLLTGMYNLYLFILQCYLFTSVWKILLAVEMISCWNKTLKYEAAI